MERKKLVKAVAISALAVSTFTLGVFASDSIEDITAQINYAIKMKVDNVSWNPTETDGSAIRPITYNGRTYLPVRALCDKLGVAVDWDNDTQTVYIGEKDWTPLNADMVKLETGGFTTDADTLYNGSGHFENGITISKDNADYTWKKDLLTPNGKFQTVKMSLYPVNLTSDVVVSIVDDINQQVYQTVTLHDDNVTTVNFDIAGATRLRIQVKGNMYDEIVIGDIYFK
jgi:hypothetical protein